MLFLACANRPEIPENLHDLSAVRKGRLAVNKG
jgi:hypothetical protein